MGTELSTDSKKVNKIRKSTRLEARVTEEQKQLLEGVAFLRGQNLTEFIVAVLTEASMQIVKDREILELTDRDRQAFVNALLNPSAPSDQAYADAQWYAQIMSG
jgi:uncharacterized protein (DUF1778 family)